MSVVAAEPDTSTPCGRVSRTEGPSPEQWDTYRPKITALYKKNTLKVVRAIMQQDHDFVGSEKMFKTRIRQWRLDKKCKAGEMSDALRIIERRKAEGKNTCVLVREKLINEADIRRYLKRQKITVNPKQQRKSKIDTNLQPHITCFTPPSTSPFAEAMDHDGDSAYGNRDSSTRSNKMLVTGLRRPLPISSVGSPDSAAQSVKHLPCNRSSERGKGIWTSFARELGHIDFLKLMSLSAEDLILLPSIDGASSDEMALTQLDHYYLHYFESSQWVPWSGEHLSRDLNSHSRSTRPCGFGADYSPSSGARRIMFPHIEFEDPGRIVASVEVATLLYGTSSTREGDLLMDTAFEKLAILLQEEHPQFLGCLLLLLGVLDSAGLFDLAHELLFHAHDLSHLLLGMSHPITLLTSWLAHSEDRDGLVDSAFRCISTFYREHAGHLHPQYLETLHNKAWLDLRRNQCLEALEALEKLHRLYQQYAEPTDLCTRKTLYSMAAVHIAQKSFSHADFLLAEVQRRIALKFGDRCRSEMMLECTRMRTVLREYQGLGYISMGLDGMLTQTFDEAEAFLGDENPFLILMRYTLLKE